MAELTIPELIRKKRDGEALSGEEIKFFVQSASNGNADLSQIGAMLMAMYKSDLNEDETTHLTSCMVHSGVTLSWPGTVVDKHSTGGVGDKVSIVLVPALASLGFTIPMISGRGLSWTGGTLDKLESIPGFKVELSRSEMEKCLQQSSSFIAATSKDICPADKTLYKIRDITSTVDNYSLISASILSKKIAAGVKYLVLDIKVGKGAFIKNNEDAEQLAKKMVIVSKMFKMKTGALLTRMDSPLGMTIGNSLEIEESVDTLLGKGPKDLLELVTYLGGILLEMSGRADTLENGKKKLAAAIADGSALNSFSNMLLSQGVSLENAIKLKKGDYSVLPRSKHQTVIASQSKGFIQDIDCLPLGKISWAIGAGRSKPEDKVDPSVGIRLSKQVGDKVEVGEALMTIFHSKPINPQYIDDALNSVKITDQILYPPSIIIKYLS